MINSTTAVFMAQLARHEIPDIQTNDSVGQIQSGGRE